MPDSDVKGLIKGFLSCDPRSSVWVNLMLGRPAHLPAWHKLYVLHGGSGGVRPEQRPLPADTQGFVLPVPSHILDPI